MALLVAGDDGSQRYERVAAADQDAVARMMRKKNVYGRTVDDESFMRASRAAPGAAQRIADTRSLCRQLGTDGGAACEAVFDHAAHVLCPAGDEECAALLPHAPPPRTPSEQDVQAGEMLAVVAATPPGVVRGALQVNGMALPAAAASASTPG